MKKILVVDDQREIRELVETTLAGETWKVLQADSGEQALQIARMEKPDLILMDVTMSGGIDGVETTRILKQSPDTQQCKIIMLTAKGQRADKKKSLEAGADGHFTKPFSPLELTRAVEALLG